MTGTNDTCSAIDSVIIFVYPAATANAGQDTSICLGTSTQLGATGGIGFSWSPSNALSSTIIDSPFADPITPMMYTVTVTDTNSCTAKDTVSITLRNADVMITANSDTICLGDTATLFANTCPSLDDNFNSGYDTRLWAWVLNGTANQDCGSVGGNALHFDGNNSREAATVNFDFTNGGLIQFWLIIGSSVDSIDCEKADSLQGEHIVLEYSIDGGNDWTVFSQYNAESIYDDWTFISDSIPAAAKTTNTSFRWRQLFNSGNKFDNWAIDDVEIICLGPGPGAPFFLWTPNSNIDDTSAQSPMVWPTVTTSYSVLVTDSDSVCTSSNSKTIVIAPLTMDAGSDKSICPGETAQLDASTNMTLVSYSWDPNVSLSCSDCEDPAASPSTSTVYTLIVTTAGCSDTDSVTVFVNPAPITTASGDTSICAGQSVTINGSGDTIIVWTPDLGLSDDSIANPLATPVASMTYYVIAISDSGCSGSIDSVVITVDNINAAYTSTTPDTVCPGGSSQLDVTVCSSLEDDFDPLINNSQWLEILGGSESNACGSFSGLSLYFNGDNDRYAMTKGMDVSQGGSINFYIKYGTGFPPCDNVDAGEDVVLEYSLNNGATWITINIYTEAFYPTLTQVTETITVGA
ncbi:MAG: hypothetical protein IH946_03930, partial [Bacteroidetes bacterium]|nr:hypothetical protein [Bacteroidota bacterium]